MPNATITSTASTFGTISGTFASDQSTVSGTIAGIITGTLTGSVGVPGPAGPTGPQGPQGEPGQGVPAGGTTGQFLTKASGTSYDTIWSTLSLAGYATESWVTAGFYPLTGNPSGFITASALTPYLPKAGGYMTGDIISTNGIGFYLANQSLGGSTYCNYTWSGIQLSSQTSALVIQPDGITFPGGGISKQTVAYPGMAAFEALFYPLNSNPAGYLTDAPSDGTIYGRQNGSWVTAGGGSYLPLAGGALDANASITASDTGTTTDSEFAGWGLGVQLTADHTKGTTVEFDGLDAYDGASHMQVTPTGLTFPDSSVQTTAATSFDPTGYATESWVASQNYATWYGGTFTGYVTWVDSGYNPTTQLSYNGITAQNDAGSMILTADGLYFPDSTTQFTAFPGFAGYATESWVYGLGYITAASVASTYAPLASPVFTGDARAVTPATSDNDTSIATTAFVKAQGYITSAPVTSVAGRTGAVTLSNTDISGLGTLAVINDAPSNGSQYARKNAAWDVVVPGDRYYTTSTTSLSVSNGNKSMTVGTGLSYTTQQSVIVAYDATHHMHGTVTSYNSSTGAMVVDVNQHTGSGTFTSWTVNVGGISSIAEWGLITGTLSSQTDLQSALDLKSNLASPTFTGTPSMPTGTTATTQTAGDNTTKLATTAFVTAAVPAFATVAQARAGTSTAVSQNPSSDLWQMMNPGFIPIIRSAFTYTATGTMGTVGLGNYTSRMTMGTLGAVSGSFRTFGGSQIDQSWICVSKGYRAYIDFSRVTWCSGRFYTDDTWADPQVTAGFYFGKAQNSSNGDLARKGFGWKLTGNATAGSRNPVLQVHNGTTLTNVTTSFALVAQQYFDWDVVSLGNGTVTLYINGTQYATTALGPTGDTSYSGTAPVIWNEEFLTTGTTAGYNATFSRGLLYIAP